MIVLRTAGVPYQDGNYNGVYPASFEEEVKKLQADPRFAALFPGGPGTAAVVGDATPPAGGGSAPK